ncbi:putative nucleic acid-binding protein [Tepidimonas ignava]|uniref:PIN domain protein n=1 Tax=Tepidimonas ignava TaxID=114249 RepID=A0A4R3LK95_9BURK|nr:putative nucleic acid-binding protein [Tepidimonas ignava]TSE22643.1 PIN domain protein [Tepidimonas ignava]
MLYLLSADIRKAEVAEGWVSAGGVVSVQVLNDAAAVARRKLGMPLHEIRWWLGAVRAACRVVPVTLADHDEALRLGERYALSLYDALIIAAALGAGAALLYTEGLQHGLVIDRRLSVIHPFAS